MSPVPSQVWDHWRAMVLAARPVVGSTDEARECASEAIVQYLERRPDDVLNLEAFLVTIAKRRALDHTRARTRARIRDDRFAREQELSAPDVAEDIAARAEAFWADEQARQLLSPRVYTLLRLVADGVPYAEVARRLDMSERAVQSHLHRARCVVRTALARTLAALGLGAAAVRKWAGTPVTAAPALAAVFVVAVHVLGGVGPTTRPALVLLPSTSWVPESRTSPAASHGAGTVVVLNRAASVNAAFTTPRLSGTTRTSIIGAQTRVIGVEVQRRDDGQQSSGPVEQVQHCLQYLRIEPGYIGCEHPSADQSTGQVAGDGPALPAVG